MLKMEKDAEILASKEMAGRLSGTEGALKSATYLADRLFEMGYSPQPGGRSFFNPINVFASRLVGEAILKAGERKFEHRVDFAEYNRVSSGGKVTAVLEIVKDGESIDEELLRGKIVLISEQPEGFDVKSTVEGAVELGVKALLIESGNPKWFSKTVFGPKDVKIPVLKVRKSIVQELESYRGQQIEIDLPLVNDTIPCNNVIGYLPGKNTEHTFVISAHYDHLGDDPNGYRFPGAIDNISGLVTVLEIARLLANRSEALPFNIVIAFFSGEESGLQGAYQFVKSFPNQITGAFNFDCIGQEENLKLVRIGYDEPNHWLPLIGQKIIERYGIEIKWKDYGGEDSVAFRKNEIPALGLGQKLHTKGVSIHTPDDQLEVLSFSALQTWSDLTIAIIEEIAKEQPYLEDELVATMKGGETNGKLY